MVVFKYYLLIIYLVVIAYTRHTLSVINRRSLIYPKPSGKVQAIFGAGFPVDLRDESVIVGIVLKAAYQVPTNSSYFTSPGVVLARKKRSLSRWDVYGLMAQLLEMYGFGGKSCLLRAVCEYADQSIDKSNGLIAEILHSLFTPTTTKEDINHYTDNDYYAAHHLGSKEGNCYSYFPECKRSFLSMFTK